MGEERTEGLGVRRSEAAPGRPAEEGQDIRAPAARGPRYAA
jgi:hypothetical protein